MVSVEEACNQYDPLLAAMACVDVENVHIFKELHNRLRYHRTQPADLRSYLGRKVGEDIDPFIIILRFLHNALCEQRDLHYTLRIHSTYPLVYE